LDIPNWLVNLLGSIVATTVGAIIMRLVVLRRERPRMERHLSETLVDIQVQLRDAKARRDDAEKQSQAARAEVESLKERLKKQSRTHDGYTRMKDVLAKASLVKSYHQPVLVVGPRYVGKTSLVKQWHAPWDEREVQGTTTHRVCEVPIFTFEEPDKAPHYAAPDVLVRVRAQLALRVHDFPGELQAQKLIGELIRKETDRLRTKSGKDLGVVIICLFDAEEAHLGIRAGTNQYYNGELFKELRRLVAGDAVRLERLVLVYNKCDLLRAHLPADAKDADLLDVCRKAFADVCGPLHSIVNTQRIREVLSVLGSGNVPFQARGETAVKVEAARPLLEAFGKTTADAAPSAYDGAAEVALG
jgi:hypothetical protein